MTSSPREQRRSQRWDPMKPAAPVTRMRMPDPMLRGGTQIQQELDVSLAGGAALDGRDRVRDRGETQGERRAAHLVQRPRARHLVAHDPPLPDRGTPDLELRLDQGD